MSDLDIIIPVYNEGANIKRTFDELSAKVRTPSRILICYDFDEDNTLPVVKNYSAAPFSVLLVKNEGHGPLGAILTGLKQSSAPAVLVLPADDHHNAGILDPMMQKFRDGCDIVVASRFVAGGCMIGCHWFKASLVRTAAFLLFYLGRLPVRDPTNGFRLFSRQLLQRLPIESKVGFAYSIELLVKAHRLGLKIGEVPAAWYERQHGSSRFRIAQWVPQYLHWFAYAFATTYFRQGPETVKVNGGEA